MIFAAGVLPFSNLLYIAVYIVAYICIPKPAVLTFIGAVKSLAESWKGVFKPGQYRDKTACF